MTSTPKFKRGQRVRTHSGDGGTVVKVIHRYAYEVEWDTSRPKRMILEEERLEAEQ